MTYPNKYTVTGFKLIPFLMVLILITVIYTVKSYAVVSYSLVGGKYLLLYDNVNVYAVRYSGSEIHTAIVDEKNCRNVTFSVMGTVKSVNVCNNCVYALSKDGDTIMLNEYSVRNDSVYHYTLGNIAVNADYRFCAAEKRICFMTDSGSGHFVCMDIYGEKIYDFSVSDEIIDYTLNYDSQSLYLFGRNNIYCADFLHNGIPQRILSTEDMRTGITVQNNVVFDYSGNMTDISAKTVTYSGITGERNSGVVNGHLCKYENGCIWTFSDNGTKDCVYRIDYGAGVQMCSKDNKVYVLSKSGKLAVINGSEFIFPVAVQNRVEDKIENAPMASVSDTKQNNTEKDSGVVSKSDMSRVEEGTEKVFSVNAYYVDDDKHIIWNIPDTTTIAALKQQITCKNYTMKFYDRNRKSRTSGKLGTGFTMEVYDGDNRVMAYTFSVNGDVTGEGNVNQNDLKLLFEYLAEKTALNDVQYVSADLNGDGNVDCIDVLRMAKKINL